MSSRICAAVAASALIALVAAVPSPAAAAGSSKSVVREFKGTVASVAARGKSFRLRRTGGPAVVVRVSKRTKVGKGAKPRSGRKLVVKARRSKKGWVARSVKLAPAPAARQPAGEDSLDDEPFEDEEDTADLPELDVDDILGDVFGDDDGSGEEEE